MIIDETGGAWCEYPAKVEILAVYSHTLTDKQVLALMRSAAGLPVERVEEKRGRVAEFIAKIKRLFKVTA